MKVSAGVHPRNQPRVGCPPSEEKVWRALRDHLPDGWHAWHSLRLQDGRGMMGEGDFVIADPERGLLVLEVKGGRMEQRGGHWLQNGRPLKRSPREQAERYVRMLVHRLEALGTLAPPWGTAVCFPDTRFDSPPTQDDLSRVTLGERELDWLGEALSAVMDRAIPSRPVRGRGWIHKVHQLWGEHWVPSLSLGTRADDLEEDRKELDEVQRATLDGLMANERVLVFGQAGSGKTLLAAECARRHAAMGLKTWLVCFTRSLGHHLDRQLDEVEVMTVGSLALHILSKTGRRTADPGQDSDAWSEVTLAAAEAVAELPPDERPGALVVDEAQDLTTDAWLLLSALADGRRMWAFTDPAQSFWADRAPPEGQFPVRFQLAASRRSPEGITALAGAYLGATPDEQVLRTAMESGTIGVVSAPSESAVPGKIGETIDRLLSDGLEPSDIFVVSLRGQTAESGVARADRLGRHQVVRADDGTMPMHVVADTFLRVKGLERPAVIVTDLQLVDGPARERAAARMYIALTRALLAVRVVAPADELRADAVLSRLL